MGNTLQAVSYFKDNRSLKLKNESLPFICLSAIPVWRRATS